MIYFSYYEVPVICLVIVVLIKNSMFTVDDVCYFLLLLLLLFFFVLMAVTELLAKSSKILQRTNESHVKLLGQKIYMLKSSSLLAAIQQHHTERVLTCWHSLYI